MRLMEGACPICASVDWRDEHEGTSFVLMPVYEVEGHSQNVFAMGDGFVVRPHVCGTCGYVRFQAGARTNQAAHWRDKITTPACAPRSMRLCVN